MPKEVLTVEDLAAVTGGMRWEDMDESRFVEDRRGWSRQRNQQVRSPTYPMPGPGPRHPGDLPSQLGYDDLVNLGRRMRQRRR